MEIEKAKSELGMERVSCLECALSEHMTEGEQGQYDYGWYCWLPGREHVSNLKSFPFKTDQKCCVPDFWHTKFAVQHSNNPISDLRVRNQFFIILEELCP